MLNLFCFHLNAIPRRRRQQQAQGARNRCEYSRDLKVLEPAEAAAVCARARLKSTCCCCRDYFVIREREEEEEEVAHYASCIRMTIHTRLLPPLLLLLLGERYDKMLLLRTRRLPSLSRSTTNHLSTWCWRRRWWRRLGASVQLSPSPLPTNARS